MVSLLWLRQARRLSSPIFVPFFFAIQTLSTFNAFLLLQGVEPLPLRLERHAKNTKKVVKYLVNHPSLPAHPNHALYTKYFPNGGASIFTFEIKGGQEEDRRFMDNLKIFSLLANVADVKDFAILFVW